MTFPADDFVTPVPLFLVQHPDGNPQAELPRQVGFLRDMRILAPSVLVYANANAGKRNPAKAKREGIHAGVFDVSIAWRGDNRASSILNDVDRSIMAFIEFKGYDARGRPGALSNAQIRWGNRMTEMGFPVASFFDPVAAIMWLRDECGAPVNLR